MTGPSRFSIPRGNSLTINDVPAKVAPQLSTSCFCSERLAAAFGPVIDQEDPVCGLQRRSLQAKRLPLSPIVWFSESADLVAGQKTIDLANRDESDAELQGSRSPDEEAARLDAAHLRDPASLPRVNKTGGDDSKDLGVIKQAPDIRVTADPPTASTRPRRQGARIDPPMPSPTPTDRGMSGSCRRVWLIDDEDALGGGLHGFGLLDGGLRAHGQAPGADEVLSVASGCRDPIRQIPVAR